MSQTLDRFSSDENSKVLCCYVNATSQIQIARITNVPNWYFERVVFPGQRLVFESHCSAVLEIHSGMMASAILSDTIPCTKLVVGKDPDEKQPSREKTVPTKKRVNISSNKNAFALTLNMAV